MDCRISLMEELLCGGMTLMTGALRWMAKLFRRDRGGKRGCMLGTALIV